MKRTPSDSRDTGFANAIRIRRAQLDLTLEDLAERTGLSPSYLSRIQNGKQGCGTTTLQKIAQALETTPDGLLQSTREESKGEPPVASGDSMVAKVVSLLEYQLNLANERAKQQEQENRELTKHLAELTRQMASAMCHNSHVMAELSAVLRTLPQEKTAAG